MDVKVYKNYVNGKWIEPENNGYVDIENPSTGKVIAKVPLSKKSEADKAIDIAHEAYQSWSQMPGPRRAKPLFKLRDLLMENEEEISRILVEEMGKSLPDARAEMKRCFENIEVACGMPMLQQSDKIIGTSFGIDGEVLRLPMGVFTVVAPFNFPAMVPFWFIPYAITTGNTVIVKPSKQVPGTMIKITEYMDKIGLPPGVYNVVNGDREVADAFIENPKVKGFSLVGSTNVCRTVAEKCARNNKRFQAMGSAKNHLIAMPDAKVDDVIRNMMTSCFGCAGQRCMASSVLVGVGDEMYNTICEKFTEAAKSVIVADPLDPRYAEEPNLMGPVISKHAFNFINKMIDVGIKEGAKLLLDGRGIKVPGNEGGHFIGPTIFADVKEGMEIHKTEIFGPVVCIMKANTLDEAIGYINRHQYGNGASIYTQNGYWAREFKLKAEAGMIGVNIGIPAPVAFLPFGGMKNSQFADIKAQGKAIVNFYTQDKIITERFWPEKD
ncbi:MAG: CoA-acylating methylmalonate-semialdehyde dehydrogenase [Candidatus Methanofastidiosa archaeon]|jgi:malonate-semialdehyde dehydrogenase (acetylating)/methylmalonate-semialdehyde dehydrogenase|nr:CoA-acylating methylmalonate-semialdehyde dehydrogenase [Candidatus Methanofastidiosa archaeon]HRS25817.1 CoA-acylating methylmalonate-semialdehyde dehydrogenase [Methanofastidiosum sp.]